MYYHPGRGLNPFSIAQFDQKALKRFSLLLRKGNYDIVFFRYIFGTKLIDTVRRVLPNAVIVVDNDVLMTRLTGQAWQIGKTFRNRFFLFESWKLERFERSLFNQPHLFFFSNSSEMKLVQDKFIRKTSRSQFACIPNIMPRVGKEQATPAKDRPYILFFGVLDSTINADAFRFLAKDIYPHIRDCLAKHDVRIRIVGKRMPPLFQALVSDLACEHIELVGEVDDMEEAIAKSLFCLVPLRMGTGTKTRLLEAAALAKTTITTPMGVEGLDFSDQEIMVRDTPRGLALAVEELLEHPERAEELGANMRDKSLALYSESRVAGQLLDHIERFCARAHDPSPSLRT